MKLKWHGMVWAVFSLLLVACGNQCASGTYANTTNCVYTPYTYPSTYNYGYPYSTTYPYNTGNYNYPYTYPTTYPH